MLDKSLEYISVLMENKKPHIYPLCPLPAGFSYLKWQPGREEAWSRLHCVIGQFPAKAQADQVFAAEFLDDPRLLAEQCFFVRDDRTGELIATGSLWPGKHFGQTHQRIHWLAVHPDYQGRGLARALLSRLMQSFAKKAYGNYIYLVSQTWSYPALNLYAHFGFTPYLGPRPANWQQENPAFVQDTHRAWQLILAKLADRAEPGLKTFLQAAL